MKPRIMYIEDKSAGSFSARIGRVTYSKSGRTIYYGGRSFHVATGGGVAGNYWDEETGGEFWISGPKRNGEDALFGTHHVPIDEDARVEYWTAIRQRPDLVDRSTT